MARLRSPRAGFSTIEIVIVLIILTSLLGSIALAMDRAVKTFEQSSANGDVNARASRAIQRVTAELIGARQSTLAPPLDLAFGSSTIEFEEIADAAGGVITWGPRRQIVMQLENGELDNGIDDDNDGLIDEQSIVRVDDPGLPTERRVTLVNGVAEFLEGELDNAIDDNGNGLIDEGGLSFSGDDDRVTISLTLQRTGPGGVLINRTQTVSLSLRN